MTKTNVMRLLEAAGIAYRTAEYEYDEANLSGLHAAEQVGMDAEQVFKTLVTRGDKTGILVFCIQIRKFFLISRCVGCIDIFIFRIHLFKCLRDDATDH